MVDFKATIRLEEQFARSTPHINLPQLRCDLINLGQWISKSTSLLQLCDSLINAPSNVFWSSVCLRPQILTEIDIALENLPLLSDIKDGGPLSNPETLASQVAELYAKLFIIFLRLTANYESEGVNSVIFRRLLQDNKVLTLKRLRLFCGIFADEISTASCLRRIVNRIRQTCPELFESYDEEIKCFLIDINSLHESLALMNAKGLGGEIRDFNAVFKFHDQLQRILRCVLSWSALYRVVPDLSPKKALLEAIPALMEDINESLSDFVLINLAVGSDQLLTSLCRSTNHLKQALTQLYIRFYENYADEIDKINVINMLLESHELLVRVADKLHDQIDIILQKCKLKDVVNRIKSEINLANAKKTREIIENLREQGLLRNLGNFSGPEIEKKIEELTDLLPYSKEFLHLVLRFYNYDHEIALERMLEPDKLPFQLRILIKDTNLLSGGDPSRFTILHINDFVSESDIEDEPEEDAGQPNNTDPTDLLALLTAAPRKKNTENKTILSAKEQKLRKTQSQLKKLLELSSDTFNMDKLYSIIEEQERRIERTEEVVEIGGKKFAKLYKNDFDPEITKEDKEMLREKLGSHKYEEEDVDEEYEKFKMEKQFETEIGMSGKFNRGYKGVTIQDMYNDEYEDSLDEHGYGLGEGITADERSHAEVKAVNPLGPLGAPKNLTFSQPIKGRPPKKSQKYPQQEESKPSGLQIKAQQSQQSQKAKPKEEQSQSTATASNRKDGYTGGKGRMMKERHKGQFKQRGADRKMQRTNPF